jgi:hypothetical protein
MLGMGKKRNRPDDEEVVSPETKRARGPKKVKDIESKLY